MKNDQLTPGPWRWKFVGNAGNYFLLGNDGEGPITHTGPDTADGRLKQAAPALLAVCSAGIGIPSSEDFATDLERIAGALDMEYFVIAQRLRAKAQAIRAAVAEVRGE